MTTSPNKTKQKLSLRKRLFVKKSPKVGCYVDTDSNEEFTQTSSRPISPVDPFIAHSAHGHEKESSNNINVLNVISNNVTSQHPDGSHDSSKEEENNKCCKTIFKKSRPKSLVEGQLYNSELNISHPSPQSSMNNLSDKNNTKLCLNPEEIARATIKFPKNNDPRKFLEHSGSFEGIKSKSKMFVKRLSADHLISTDNKPFYHSSSPESDRSSSLDRKRR